MNNEKLIVGLDVGVNSVGWSAILLDEHKSKGRILHAGSRIIPMDQKEIGDFNKGNLQSAVSQRTDLRGVRRLKERHQKRRERLVKTLKNIGFITKGWDPNHKYSFAYEEKNDKSFFKFQDAYKSMKRQFISLHPDIKSVTHDWTIYYLRSIALKKKLSQEELAWIILQFNAKRGYYQLRDDKELDTSDDKYFISSIVDNIVDTGEESRNNKILTIHLRDDIVAQYNSKEIPDWIGKRFDFIITEKKISDGTIKVTLSLPAEDDWTLRKKRTESQLEKSEKHVGEYIYSKLLEDPSIKIRGKEVHTIDRKFYKKELINILQKQAEFHPELSDKELLINCAKDLYKKNVAHRKNLLKFDIIHLLVEDIIYYQRPLKSKKYLLSNCKYENYRFKKDGEIIEKPVKVAPKSHPLYQEFRIWDIIHNLRVLEKEARNESGIIQMDVDRSEAILTDENKEKLYKSFLTKETISDSNILKTLGLKTTEFSLNYPAKTKFKGHELIATITKACKEIDKNKVLELISSTQVVEGIWHAIYSITDDDKYLENALNKLAIDNDIVDCLLNLPGFPKEYGAFSVKALKKLVPLMRCGNYWTAHDIHPKTYERIEKIIHAEVDQSVAIRARVNLQEFTKINDFSGLNITKASYVVYDRHSESATNSIYDAPEEINIQELLPAGSLRNPTAEKVIRETILVVRDIWQTFGKPAEIHVELAREMKLSNDKRLAYTERRDENFKRNKRAKKLLKELQTQGDRNVNPHSRGHIELIKLYEEGALGDESKVEKSIKAIVNKDDPSTADIQRYRLWLEQKYFSPYTGKIIPLSKLFSTEYDIEHIIPRGLYYDDSFNNKIICERSINSSKGNRTAYEMICSSEGSIKGDKILEKEQYEDLIRRLFYFSNRSKYNRLLQYDPPAGFTSRQLNNTRFINRKLLQYLDPFVREKDEKEAVSKNLISMAGGITNQLKNDWGLQDKWKELLRPRFERMNEINGSADFITMEGNKIHLSGYENELKRLDHRHHALDAIIIACTTRRHIMYKNSLRSDKRRRDLEPVLFNKDSQGRKSSYKMPWDSFPSDVLSCLQNIIVSFKYNHRVINKTINYYQKYIEQADGSWKKGYVKQATNPDHWAVRNAMHQETIYGKIVRKSYKAVSINTALKDPTLIGHKATRKRVLGLFEQFNDDLKQIKKALKENPIIIDGQEITKLDYTYFDEFATSQMKLTEKTTVKQLEGIVDESLKQEIKSHLESHNNDSSLAFSENGLISFNENRLKPVKNVTVLQDLGISKRLGEAVPKNRQYIKGAKGTNLYFVIHENIVDGTQHVDKESTVAFTDVIDAMKEGESFVVPRENHTYFTLSPGDLVYVFDEGEEKVLPNPLDKSKIYKCVSFTKQQCFFIPYIVTSPIVDKKEFGPLNKQEKSLEDVMIKYNCRKIQVDRLGKLIQ